MEPTEKDTTAALDMVYAFVAAQAVGTPDPVGDATARIARALAAAREEGGAKVLREATVILTGVNQGLTAKMMGTPCIVDCTGDSPVVRKVDTTGWNPADTDESVPLPVYADGELWMMGEEAYTISDDGEVVEFYTYDHPPRWTESGWVVPWGDGEIELNKCYSNHKAAEAARKAPQ